MRHTRRLTALILSVLFSLSVLSGQPVYAQTGECLRLCDSDFMATATAQDIHTEFAKGADITARTEDGKTPFDFAKDNDKLKGTEAYWLLNEARFK